LPSEALFSGFFSKKKQFDDLLKSNRAMTLTENALMLLLAFEVKKRAKLKHTSHLLTNVPNLLDDKKPRVNPQ